MAEIKVGDKVTCVIKGAIACARVLRFCGSNCMDINVFNPPIGEWKMVPRCGWKRICQNVRSTECKRDNIPRSVQDS